MSSLFLDNSIAPDEIKSQLKVLSRDIRFSREVTKGGNGYLFFGENRILNTKVAVKFYYWGGDAKYHAEPNTLASINSPHILSVQSAGLIDGEWAYFVTPYCSRGDMDDVIEQTELGNTKAIDFTCELLIGVGALHEKRFLHRDLKPANIYVGDEEQSIIGDFGSIKYMPVGMDSIPASSHSILYRPPESIETNSYGFAGDIYQSGIVLYQLLGGFLPYDETSWLSKSERKRYNDLGPSDDRSIFVDQCLKTKIKRGRIIDLSSLPPWVPEKLKRTISRATNINPRKRFPTASAFHVHLNNLRPVIPDWVIEQGVPVMRGATSFRICYGDNELYYVQKSCNCGQWRRDNSFNSTTISGIAAEINERV
ncbi:MAG: protein kinase [Deltaproteobacteria bacterium]|nr:protein kinase [Deltaproteobacteria bacterium]